MVYSLSNIKNRKYKTIYSVGDKDYIFDRSQAGKYIKTKVTSVECRTRYGETVKTQPIQLTTERYNLSFYTNGGSEDLPSHNYWEYQIAKIPHIIASWNTFKVMVLRNIQVMRPLCAVYSK